MVIPAREAPAPPGAGGGTPGIVGTGPGAEGWPESVVACAAMRTEKTRSHWGHRTRSPAAGIFSGSTSYPAWHCGQVMRIDWAPLAACWRLAILRAS
jgi:hypothetical protein